MNHLSESLIYDLLVSNLVACCNVFKLDIAGKWCRFKGQNNPDKSIRQIFDN